MSLVYPPKDKYGSKMEEVKQIGIHVVKSDEGAWRRKQYEKMCEKLKEDVYKNVQLPEDVLNNLEKKFLEVSGLMRHGAVPWGRGGTKPEFAKLMFAWERMNGKVKAFLNTMKEIVKEQKLTEIHLRKKAEKGNGDALEKARLIRSTSWDTVRKVVNFMNIEVFSRSLAIANVCWHEQDVAVKTVIAIQQPILNVQQRESMTSEAEF